MFPASFANVCLFCVQYLNISSSPVYLQVQAALSSCQSDSGDSVSIRPNRGVTNKLLAKVAEPSSSSSSSQKKTAVHDNEGFPSAVTHQLPAPTNPRLRWPVEGCGDTTGSMRGGDLSAIKRGRRKKRRQRIALELGSSSEEEGEGRSKPLASVLWVCSVSIFLLIFL